MSLSYCSKVLPESYSSGMVLGMVLSEVEQRWRSEGWGEGGALSADVDVGVHCQGI